MMNNYFGFSGSPFENSLDQRFFFLSENHKEVLAALLYFIKERKGFALVCGDVGTGKTMLINSFLEKLPKSFQPIILSSPDVEYMQILSYIAAQLGIASAGKGPLELIDEVKNALIEASRQEKHFVLIVDEAHLLSHQSLEHLRLFSNIETQDQKLLQILLVGQYEISHKLDRVEMHQLRRVRFTTVGNRVGSIFAKGAPSLRIGAIFGEKQQSLPTLVNRTQPRQRINIYRFLAPMELPETVRYIDHRLAVVGSSFDSCFEPSCRKLIYKMTDGVPRRINQLCDSALRICEAERAPMVNRKILEKANSARKSTDTSMHSRYAKALVLIGPHVMFLGLLGILGYGGYLGKTLQHLIHQEDPAPFQHSPQKSDGDLEISDPGPQLTDKETGKTADSQPPSALSSEDDERNIPSLGNPSLDAVVSIPDKKGTQKTANAGNSKIQKSIVGKKGKQKTTNSRNSKVQKSIVVKKGSIEEKSSELSEASHVIGDDFRVYPPWHIPHGEH